MRTHEDREKLNIPELVRDEQGLALAGAGMVLRGDFTGMLKRVKGGRIAHEMLIKAAKLKEHSEPPTAMDCTAGLGEDSFLLAAAGFRVDLYEHNPVIAALLADALERAANVPELADIVLRMTLHQEDSLSALMQMSSPPDIIYLDPMFPEKQKNSLTGKKLQLFQKLEVSCANEEELLQAAIAAGPRKIIIKRPLKGPELAGIRPGYSIKGKAIRYDCIVIPR